MGRLSCRVVDQDLDKRIKEKDKEISRRCRKKRKKSLNERKGKLNNKILKTETNPITCNEKCEQRQDIPLTNLFDYNNVANIKDVSVSKVVIDEDSTFLQIPKIETERDLFQQKFAKFNIENKTEEKSLQNQFLNKQF